MTDMDNSLSIECHYIEAPEECGSIMCKYPIKILHVNIRSMQCNFDNFLIILARLGIPFDLIIMSECWIGPGSTIKQLNGYQSFNTEKYINRAGGVIAYVSDKWSPIVTEPELDEANCLVIEVPNFFTVLGIYRSPSFKNTENFITSLDCNVKALPRNPYFAVVGDLNINILDSTTFDENTSTYLNLMSEHGLISAINAATHDKTCIDHIFISGKMLADSVICPVDLTDHSLTMVGISGRTRKPLQRTKLRIDYSNLKIDLEKTDWGKQMKNVSLEDDVTSFSATLSATIANHSRVMRITHSKFNIKPWITPGLIRCSKHRDKLHADLRKFPEDKNKKLIYTRYRNFYGSLLRRLKSEYESKELQNNKNCSRKLWKSINQISHRSPLNSASNAYELLNQSNCSERQSLDACNSYFSNVGRNLASSILSRLNETQESLASKVIHKSAPRESFFISPTNAQEIVDLILSLDSNSSPGVDNISNRILKVIGETIATPLSVLFNRSIESGIFNKVWKTAVVIPIYKGAAKNDPSNYRPISLLGTISKLLERIINKRLLSYLESNNLINNRQFGFRRGKSTEDAVTLLTDIVSTHLDNGRNCVGVFLDLAKAFDAVSAPILLRKLEGFRIRGSALHWFSSYLTDRVQCIRIGEHLSNTSTINFGVPQGSILGPTLFIMYINDLCLIPIRNADFICYADDTALIFHGRSWDIVRQKTEDGMSLILEWLTKNLLTLNTTKTKHLCFHKTVASAPSAQLNTIKIHGCKGLINNPCNCDHVKRANNLRYLGIILDEKLTFKEHIAVMSGRVRKMIHVVRNLREAADGKTLKMVYLTLCQSIINYCILAWGGVAKATLITLERAQRGVLKVALFKPLFYPTHSLYDEAEVLTVRKLFLLRAILYTHKIVRSSDDYNELLGKRIFKIPTPTTKTSFSHHFGRFLFPFVYNKLVNLLNFRSSSEFEVKSLLTKTLLSWSYEYTEDCLKVAH
jgi:hypothetical protein